MSRCRENAANAFQLGVLTAADCDDRGVCTRPRCVDYICVYQPRSILGDVSRDGEVDVADILCVLDAFQGLDTCVIADADIAGCVSDGKVDLSDIMAVLDAFGGVDACCDSPGN